MRSGVSDLKSVAVLLLSVQTGIVVEGDGAHFIDVEGITGHDEMSIREAILSK